MENNAVITFKSHRRKPTTFETIPLGDQTDDVPSASDQMRILLLICKQMATLPSTIDVTESHWKTSYLACLGGHNVDDFVKRSLHLQSAFTKCRERSLDSYVLRKQKTQV
nr:unnamed protein product [Spirometra erinaceieuropaei]